MKKYNVTVNGNTYEVEVEEVGSEVSKVSRPQVTQSSPRPQATPKQQAAPVLGGGNVLSPMPGTINDVRVKAGDSVKKGQILLILEAMKMENEIMANSDGTVSAVNISKGSSVNAGDVLVTIG
ncbi:MAG TPA: biotin/lipoyl-containing protein [Romboutsia sp.]|nr:biotin/lipoyl-containing protein [Romboutsia sp.]HSQ89685.1 biotin/lipoyl-containing protein [Romboutsia sp.]